MTIVDGWLQHPDFIRIDGHPLKMYAEPNTGDGGLACHSVVGEEPDYLDGVPNRFLSDDRNPDGSFTDYAAASCMFILRKRMPHIQMYPTWASTWTSGSRGANTTTWAFEAEGGGIGNTTEPLTEHQVQGFLAVATAWEQVKGKTLQVGRGLTVRAHWQLVKDLGGAATACESGRYRHAWDRLTAGERYGADDMTPEEREEHKALLAIFGGRDKVLKARDGGMDFLLGYAIEQADQRQLKEAIARLEAAGRSSVLLALRDELNALPS